MKKYFAAIVGVLFILCSINASAQMASKDTSSKIIEGPAISTAAKVGPDLTVTSAKITARPFQLGTNVLVPLQITIKNVGSIDVRNKLFVSAWGIATDGNVNGYYFGAAGETVESDSVVVNRLAAGAQKTINGILMLTPTGTPTQAGTKYEVLVEVDGTTDPDFYGNIDEMDETNNELEAKYP